MVRAAGLKHESFPLHFPCTIALYALSMTFLWRQSIHRICAKLGHSYNYDAFSLSLSLTQPCFQILAAQVAAKVLGHISCTQNNHAVRVYAVGAACKVLSLLSSEIVYAAVVQLVRWVVNDKRERFGVDMVRKAVRVIKNPIFCAGVLQCIE